MGSNASTHAKAASASSESSNVKGSSGKQQVGVGGHILCMRLDSNSHHANDNDNKTDLTRLVPSNANGEPIKEKKGKEGSEKDNDIVLVEKKEIALDDAVTTDTDVDDSASVESEFDDDSDDEDEEYDEEILQILEDAKKLKILAQAYLHPEKPVVTTDPTAFGRNYFTTPSAIQLTETFEEAEERAQILEDAVALKQSAIQYMHPEIPVVQTEEEKTFMCTRNYFDREDAPEQESVEDAEERRQILEDAKKLKQLAVDYMHPEIGVDRKATDGAAFGRNYFNRPSAEDVHIVDKEEEEERIRIMADLKALKQAAKDYLHPEIGVENVNVDPRTFGRNYFNRASAPETEDDDYADERAHALADAASLKKLAVDYMHPEIGVKVQDPALFGRNYFNRASAPETEDHELAEQRAQVLADAASLKKLAVDYMHPEIGVRTTDAFVSGRNYFNRPTAPETEDDEYADEREDILDDMKALKKYAVDYMHPELGVKVQDPTVFGRNYFNRPSAPETEDVDYANERAQVLADASEMKKHVVYYMHPEKGVEVQDATISGRNYFNRPSAPDTEDVGYANERAQVMADAAAMKKYAVDYMHPELPATNTDPTTFGRNYFNTLSVGDIESQEEAEGRARILSDAAEMKNHAVDYMHPEIGVKTTDYSAYGKSYFPPDKNVIYTEGCADVSPKDSSSEEEESSHDHMFEFEDAEVDDYDFTEMRNAFQAFVPIEKPINDSTMKHENITKEDEDEGNLSRSPSSVMLFGLEGSA